MAAIPAFQIPECSAPGNLPCDRRSSRSLDPKHRVIGRIRQCPKVGPNLAAPAREIRFDDARLLVVGDLGRPEGLDPATPAKFASAGGAQIAHPLRIPARGDEITLRGNSSTLTGTAPPPLVRPCTARVGTMPSHISMGFRDSADQPPGPQIALLATHGPWLGRSSVGQLFFDVWAMNPPNWGTILCPCKSGTSASPCRARRSS